MLNTRNYYIKGRLREIDKKLDEIKDPAEAVALVNEKMRLIEEDTNNSRRFFGNFMNVMEIAARIAAIAVPAAVTLKQLKMQDKWFYDGLRFEVDGTVCSDMNKQVWRNAIRPLH